MKKHSPVMIVFTIFALLAVISSNVVEAAEMWSQTYGGTDDDIVGSVVQTSDGGYVLAAHTNSFGVGRYDFFVVKADDAGVVPEFPSWIIPPLFLIATFSAIALKKRLRHQRSQEI